MATRLRKLAAHTSGDGQGHASRRARDQKSKQTVRNVEEEEEEEEALGRKQETGKQSGELRQEKAPKRTERIKAVHGKEKEEARKRRGRKGKKRGRKGKRRWKVSSFSSLAIVDDSRRRAWQSKTNE